MLKLAQNYHNHHKIIYIIINNNYSHYFTWGETLLLPSASVSSAMALATQMKLPNAMETETTGSWANKKMQNKAKPLKVCSKLKLWAYFVPSPKCLKVTIIEQVHIYIQKSSEHTNTSSSYGSPIFFFSLPSHLYLLMLTSEVGRSRHFAKADIRDLQRADKASSSCPHHFCEQQLCAFLINFFSHFWSLTP